MVNLGAVHLKILQPYVSWSALKVFFIMIVHNSQTKEILTLIIYFQKSSFGVNERFGNFHK